MKPSTSHKPLKPTGVEQSLLSVLAFLVRPEAMASLGIQAGPAEETSLRGPQAGPARTPPTVNTGERISRVGVQP